MARWEPLHLRLLQTARDRAGGSRRALRHRHRHSAGWQVQMQVQPEEKESLKQWSSNSTASPSVRRSN